MRVEKSIKIGEMNTLLVERDSKYGLYLRAEDFREVLLPNIYVVEEEMRVGSTVDVFIYTDSEDRLVASTKRPYAMVGEFGYFTVVDYKQYGAFVNWGLPKDLFVPLSQQKNYFNIGNKHILRVCLDEKTGRVYGTEKIGKWISHKPEGLEKGQKVSIFIISKTPLGYKAIVENLYEGMIFKNEIFEKVNIGDRKDAYIKNIRGDGKLDISLQPTRKKSSDIENEEKVLNIVKDRGGVVDVSPKSDASKIIDIFSMSKKSFKRAVNSLINANKIIKDNSSIRLNS